MTGREYARHRSRLEIPVYAARRNCGLPGLDGSRWARPSRFASVAERANARLDTPASRSDTASRLFDQREISGLS